MRGAIRTGAGIAFASTVPTPVPKAGQVLLRVVCAGINPIDYKLPKFIAGTGVGLDVAGIVEATGPDVSAFSKGDEVMGFASGGGLADFALADVGKLAKKPSGLPWASAGALQP